jgi:hypothetical protein
MADIKYERNGVEKLAGERFKDALIAEGWSVVEDKPKRGRPAKKDDDGEE